MGVTGTFFNQEPLIFMELELLQANHLIGTLLQRFCQREQSAPRVWQPEAETVQRQQGK